MMAVGDFYLFIYFLRTPNNNKKKVMENGEAYKNKQKTKTCNTGSRTRFFSFAELYLVIHP